MGYRSEVYIGVDKKHQQEFESLLKEQELENITKKVREDKFIHYVVTYGAWYDLDSTVNIINNYIEDKSLEDDSAYMLCVGGKVNEIYNEIGCYWDYLSVKINVTHI